MEGEDHEKGHHETGDDFSCFFTSTGVSAQEDAWKNLIDVQPYMDESYRTIAVQGKLIYRRERENE